MFGGTAPSSVLISNSTSLFGGLPFGRFSGNNAENSSNSWCSSLCIPYGTFAQIRFRISATGGALRTGPVVFICSRFTFCVIPCTCCVNLGRTNAKYTDSTRRRHFCSVFPLINCLVPIQSFLAFFCTVPTTFAYCTLSLPADHDLKELLLVCCLDFVDMIQFCFLHHSALFHSFVASV